MIRAIEKKKRRWREKEEGETVWVWEYGHGGQAQQTARASPMRQTPSEEHPELAGRRKGKRRARA